MRSHAIYKEAIAEARSRLHLNCFPIDIILRAWNIAVLGSEVIHVSENGVYGFLFRRCIAQYERIIRMFGKLHGIGPMINMKYNWSAKIQKLS